MKLLTDDADKTIAIIMDRKDARALVTILQSAMEGKKLNKSALAYKMAKALDDELPIY